MEQELIMMRCFCCLLQTFVDAHADARADDGHPIPMWLADNSACAATVL